jgi:hypothetical protein
MTTEKIIDETFPLQISQHEIYNLDKIWSTAECPSDNKMTCWLYLFEDAGRGDEQ